MSLINLNHITKDYGNGRGIFDVNIAIEEGEVFGYVGTNGAGKTTTLRHLMGFLKPSKGFATINGLNCWGQSAEVKRMVGYVPGEIAFPDAPTGNAFLKRQAELSNLKDMRYAEKIIKKLQLDPSANLKRMSKGMKQKTAIVAAFMTDSPILILDEPTTGLDPLMRAEFVDLIKAEKKKGKTIIMSSHMFEELEDTCDKVAMIKDGHIIDVKETKEIKHNQDKVFKIEFKTSAGYQHFLTESFKFTEKRPNQNQVIIEINDQEINQFNRRIRKYEIKFISEKKYTLEKYFKSLY